MPRRFSRCDLTQKNGHFKPLYDVACIDYSAQLAKSVYSARNMYRKERTVYEQAKENA